MATDRKCVRIPSAGGYEKLVVEAIGGEGYTYGANVTAENRSSCVRVKVKVSDKGLKDRLTNLARNCLASS